MARIPDEELSRLKREVAIASLVEASGVALTKRGADLVGLCPFHADSSPSLVVSPSKQLWHCMGACRAGGSVVDWAMRKEGVSFRQAIEILRAGAPSTLDVTGSDSEVLDRVVAHYQRALEQSPEALAYLDARGLSRELIARFRLGFANRTLGYRATSRAARTRLQDLGVLRASGHEHLNGSLVVPLVDEQGRVVNLYGRKIGDDLRPGTPLHLYLPGPHRGFLNPAALTSTSKTVIVCEAIIDALTFVSAGIENVTTAYGVEGFTGELLDALVRHGVERVLIAYDAAAAGDAAAHALAQRLEGAGIASSRVVFPKGMDANAYALKVQPAAKSLALVVEKAVPMRESKTAAKEEAVKAAAPSFAAEPQPAPPASPSTSADADELVLTVEDRHYRARGLLKNTTHASLRTTLTVSLGERGERMHVDTLDLYASKARAFFAREAARELALDEDVLKRDLGRVILALEEAIDRRLVTELQPRALPAMSADDEAEALALLSDPHLSEHVVSDLERLGLVGEDTNKLVTYLAMTSRKLERPLAVVIQSSSAAGKSSLMDAVLSLCPDEEKQKYSAMTGQALFYMSGAELRHKVLAVVEEAGAERASYALKLLQSEGELSIASTGKDEKTGKLVTHESRVEGPVALMLTTTSVEMDEELLNRCLVLSVDEGRAQTRAIHEAQRRKHTLEGIVQDKKRASLLRMHNNAQRLLRPLHVVNPYAGELTFRDDKTRLRRDHAKYLGLIDAIALLHQHQRATKTITVDGAAVEYIEATLADIALANRLAHAVLGRSLDELPSNPASDLELPKHRRTLPRHVLTIEEVEKVLAVPDVSTTLGLRDRAILELLYSSGLRRSEVAALALDDVDASRGLVTVRHGKGNRQRVVPIGERALQWVQRYLDEARAELILDDDDGTLFLSSWGGALGPNTLSAMAKRYIDLAGVKKGACHVFRHTMATQMLEHGADVRFIQEILGHASLETTQVYTKVSVLKLKEVHRKTHPAGLPRPPRDDDEQPPS